eukprot:scaffold2507_cov122-Isochrysis_galbana.AAC.22
MATEKVAEDQTEETPVAVATVATVAPAEEAAASSAPTAIVVADVVPEPEDGTSFALVPSTSRALILKPDKEATLEMIKSEASASGFKGVKKHHKGGYQARVKRDGKKVHLGTFASAEEAAMAYAASAEGMKAMAKAANSLPAISAEEAQRLAAAEGLTLVRATNNKTGYKGVYKIWSKFQARVVREGKVVILGSFHSAEEAALCYARAPEGQAAAIKMSRA